MVAPCMRWEKEGPHEVSRAGSSPQGTRQEDPGPEDPGSGLRAAGLALLRPLDPANRAGLSHLARGGKGGTGCVRACVRACVCVRVRVPEDWSGGVYQGSPVCPVALEPLNCQALGSPRGVPPGSWLLSPGADQGVNRNLDWQGSSHCPNLLSCPALVGPDSQALGN